MTSLSSDIGRRELTLAAKLRGIQGDSKAAAFWYRRATELGIAEADILLKGIQTK